MPRHCLRTAAFALLVPLGINSCGSVGNAGYLYQTAAAAHDHIMLVRENPPTFGFQRLEALSVYYPDLEKFIETKGQPRYYAETRSGGSRYLILYYPKSLEAYACRSFLDKAHQIEFSGPYPITRNELKTLRELEAKIDQGFDS